MTYGKTDVEKRLEDLEKKHSENRLLDRIEKLEKGGNDSKLSDSIFGKIIISFGLFFLFIFMWISILAAVCVVLDVEPTGSGLARFSFFLSFISVGVYWYLKSNGKV